MLPKKPATLNSRTAPSPSTEEVDSELVQADRLPRIRVKQTRLYFCSPGNLTRTALPTCREEGAGEAVASRRLAVE